jgi:hypothetical protein
MTEDDSRRDEGNRLSRRTFIGTSTTTMLTLAGCIGSDDGGDDGNGNENITTTDEGDGTSSPETIDEDNVPDLPQVEDPPEAVYVPSHKNQMEMLPTVESGEYAVTPMLTYPHKFWLITGDEREVVNPDSFGVHLMVTVWDAETGTVLPVDKGAPVTLTKDGEFVGEKAPWPMISQRMGFHFGENFSLPDYGTYEAELGLNPLTGVRKTGEFDGRFESSETITFEFEFTKEAQQQLANGIEYLDESRWGERDALGPMGMGGTDDGDGGSNSGENGGDDGGMEMSMQYSSLPPAESYPGTAVGTPQSGDATFVVRYLDETAMTDEDTGYLLVSPRTPYNRVPLPDMALSATGALEGELIQALDSEIGHHYGLPGSLSAGDQLQLVIDSPPQVARHRGYETAFLEMPPIDITMPEP